MKRIAVDKKLCIGCGACVAECDSVLEMGSDGKAKVKGEWEKGDKSLPSCAQSAIDVCPAGAIKSLS